MHISDTHEYDNSTHNTLTTSSKQWPTLSQTSLTPTPNKLSPMYVPYIVDQNLVFRIFKYTLSNFFFLKLFFHINQLSFNLFFKQTLFTLCEMSIIFNNIYYFFIQTQQTYIIIKHEIPYSSTFI